MFVHDGEIQNSSTYLSVLFNDNVNLQMLYTDTYG